MFKPTLLGGAVYHWCAPAPGGLRISDAWETREDFDRFARDKIGPITAKHGLSAPAVEVTDIHEIILGHATSRQGTGVIIEADGDQQTLLKTIDEANKKMQTNDKPPQGLICHWTTTRDGGIRVIDHWRSREDFDTFANSILGPTLKALNMPPARFEFFDVHNDWIPGLPPGLAFYEMRPAEIGRASSHWNALRAKENQAYVLTRFGSTFTPGPIVLVSVMLRR